MPDGSMPQSKPTGQGDVGPEGPVNATDSSPKTEPVSPEMQSRVRAPAIDQSPTPGVDEYERTTGERLTETLNIDSWEPAHRLAEAYGRFEREVADAVRTEALVRRDVRKQVLPLLSRTPHAPPAAGHYFVSPAQLRDVQRKVLFNGLTQAVDGTSVPFESLPLNQDDSDRRGSCELLW
jgi:hypothetical protein